MSHQARYFGLSGAPYWYVVECACGNKTRADNQLLALNQHVEHVVSAIYAESLARHREIADDLLAAKDNNL